MSKQVYMRDGASIIQTDTPAIWEGAERLPQAEGEKLFREQAASKLRQFFKPGDTAYTVLKHVSANGMSRHISVFGAAVEERKNFQGELQTQCVPVDLSHFVANLLGYKLAKDGALVVSGCGQDMGFHVVYAMSARMFPNGTDKPHGRRNGSPDSDGGYAINHRWL